MPEAGTTAVRTFSEGETYALVDQAVQRETAGLESEKAALATQVDQLNLKVDTLETEKAQAVQRAEDAEGALTAFKADIETEKAREAKRGERVDGLKTANPFLELTPERENRIVAMTDEAFDAYLGDMREVAAKAAPPAPVAGDLPRESAAFRPAATTDNTHKGTVSSLVAARRALTTAKGA